MSSHWQYHWFYRRVPHGWLFRKHVGKQHSLSAVFPLDTRTLFLRRQTGVEGWTPWSPWRANPARTHPVPVPALRWCTARSRIAKGKLSVPAHDVPALRCERRHRSLHLKDNGLHLEVCGSPDAYCLCRVNHISDFGDFMSWIIYLSILLPSKTQNLSPAQLALHLFVKN